MPGQITAAEIRTILGPVDDVLLVAITRTGATAADVMEAFTRLEGEEARRSANDTVRAVMALLLAAELPSGDRE